MLKSIRYFPKKRHLQIILDYYGFIDFFLIGNKNFYEWIFYRLLFEPYVSYVKCHVSGYNDPIDDVDVDAVEVDDCPHGPDAILCIPTNNL